MKETRFALICILSSLLLCCCTNESDNDTANPSDMSIGFTIDTSAQSEFTRGTPLGGAAGIPNMGVYAYYTGNGTSNNWSAKGSTATPNFLNGITVTQNGGAWSYANAVYWPQAADANVSFFAYSPVTTTNNGITITNTTGTTKLKYTVPSTCTDQPDLLVAVPQTDRNKTNNGTSAVNFTFKHALTGIGFKLAGGGQKVTSIKLKGVRTSGTLSMNGATIAWTDLSIPQTTEFTAGLSGSNGVTSTDVLTGIVSGNGFLMMIPQTLGTDAELTVTFSNWVTTTIQLSGKEWKAGEKVWYSLTMPESEVVGKFAGDVVGPVSNGDYEEYYYSKTLEVDVIDSPDRSAWSSSLSLTNINNRMNGKQNTFDLYKLSSTDYPPAKYCFEKNKNYAAITGRESANYQWYLPAQNELMAVSIAMPSFKASVKDAFYWSSTEHNQDISWVVHIQNGSTYNVEVYPKTYVRHARCVRETSN